MFERYGMTTTELNLREGPGLDHAIITRLPDGALLTIEGEAAPWFQVTALGYHGYVHSDYVQLPLAAKTVVQVGVHTEPGQHAAIVNALFEDTQVLVFQEDAGWLPVIALGEPGYIPADTVAFPRVAETCGHVNLRTGPGTDHRILEMVPPGVQVHVWQKHDDWYYVADTTMSGYLHEDFVALAQDKPRDAGISGRKSDAFQDVALEPPDAEKLHPGPDAGQAARRAAGIWNRLGGLLKPLAAQLEIDPAVAVAVLAVESGGRAFGDDGRMIIRFENHIFYRRWGEKHADVYEQHFKFDPDRNWQDHHWRRSSDQPWQPFHGDQVAEWEVLDFACALDDTAAKMSISMGGPQIMGFNYASLGYASVQAMFDAFAESERAQVLGLFDFIQGRSLESPRIAALRALDFEGFARYYNGSGQAQTYGNLIQTYYEAFHSCA